MSIHLSIKADDPQVENILAYLDSQQLSREDKVYLLERSLKWLRACDTGVYDISPDQGSLSLVVVASSPNYSRLAGKQAAPCAEQSASQASHR